MRGIILGLFSPGWNRFTLIGFLLMILGIILIPVLIGIPIAGIGFSMLAISAIVSFVRLFPGGKKLVSEFEAMFLRMFSWLKIVIKDGFK